MSVFINNGGFILLILADMRLVADTFLLNCTVSVQMLFILCNCIVSGCVEEKRNSKIVQDYSNDGDVCGPVPVVRGAEDL